MESVRGFGDMFKIEWLGDVFVVCMLDVEVFIILNLNIM